MGTKFKRVFFSAPLDVVRRVCRVSSHGVRFFFFSLSHSVCVVVVVDVVAFFHYLFSSFLNTFGKLRVV